jgi:hypothetical protein
VRVKNGDNVEDSLKDNDSRCSDEKGKAEIDVIRPRRRRLHVASPGRT